MAIDLRADRLAVWPARLLDTSAEPSLLSEVSVVLLAERVKAESETSAHKPAKVHVSKQGIDRVHKLLCQPHQHLALLMVRGTKPVVLR